ncbi:alpha-2-macroglobulin-like, partial [Clarias magur]
MDEHRDLIESGSEAKLCVSLLKPNETLQMTIYLVNDNESRTLLQETVEEEIHRCSDFEAPQVERESVQEIKVEVKGESFKMTEKRKVMFKSYNTLGFIQTDKPIYNPGQTVNFRIVTMDSNFIPLEQKYSTVILEDIHHNRIGQWTNVSSTGLILQLSHKLNAEAPQGDYSLKAKIENRLITHHFKVQKYVLPKFEITVNAPNQHSVGEEELKLEVCGKYTYGQPVPGQALVQVCRKFTRAYIHHHASPCLVETVEMSQAGCGVLLLNVTSFIKSKFEARFDDRLNATATLTEEGTEYSISKSVTIDLTYQIGKVEFVNVPKTFEHQGVIEGEIKVTTFSGTPVPNRKVYLYEDNWWPNRLLLNLTTDSNGLAKFSLASPEPPTTEKSLLATANLEELHHRSKTPFFTSADANIRLLQPATSYSPVFSELSIESSEEPFKCGAEISINVNYYIVGETTESFRVDIIYMVISRGTIVHHGHEKVEVKDSTDFRKGNILFKLSVDAELAPVVQVVAYSVLPSKNVIAAKKNFDVEKCLKNKVSLKFSPIKAVPGEKNTLEVSAHPGSLCGLGVVDQSVFILESGGRLNTNKIFNMLPVTTVSDYHYRVEDDQGCLHVRPRRYARTDHVYNTLKGVGLKMVTNLAIRYPDCLMYRGVQYHRRFGYEVQYMRGEGLGMAGVAYSRTALDPIETVRNFFPETWIWQLAEVGDSGSVELPVTVPDTITTWETEAFCVSSKGLGLAPPVQLTVFQPFFLELTLPYSIIRGEVFELKATVFNYLSKCIMVKVTPAPSSDYTLEPSSDGEYSSCLCVNGRKTFKWTLIPSVLGALNVTVSAEAEQSQTVCDNEIVSVPERGRIDTVTRSLIVKAEGTEKTKSQSWLLCPQGNSVSEDLELSLPEDVVKGSARASVSVLGDILGRALKNLDGLLRMPYGCGEQNIALLAPNIYILQYLENTEQLTTAIRERATGFLESGYQRQLNYKHINGAYSTFGRGEGNTWLTAFVLRTFGKAQRYIFIDPEIISSAKKWLIHLQREDGCFITQGSLFNNRMKGGVNDDVTITAYIIASLLELGNTVQDPVVNKGLMCLKSSVGNLTNTYATALLAYTFSLAGENEARQHLLKELDTIAISGDGNLHWSQSASDDSGALSVEISSYVLLAVLTTGQLTTSDLGYANRIVSWLVKQQNPYGGFSSTQDTVVALQALALYSTKVFSSDGSSTVTVKSEGADSHNFDVNQDNKLLYQERSLQDVPGKYNIEVKGSSCVSVQTSLFYNVPTPTETSTLSIMAKTEGNCTKSSGQTLSLEFTVQYSGSLNKTNMIIVDIKLLSGFTADPGELNNALLVERVDSKDDHFIMYIKELERNIPISYKLHIKQVLPVKNLKAAVIRIYDYYQTILPKFEITVKAPKEHSVGEEELKLEVCGKYTYGQPVPGTARVQVCRKFGRHYLHREDAPFISPCLTETVEMSQVGCASLRLNVSAFMNSEFENNFEDNLNATVTMTEEGTEFSMVKSIVIELTYQIGKVELLDLPKSYEREKVIEGRIKVATFSGRPVPNRKVYLSEGKRWAQKILLNLTTDSNGLVKFLVPSPQYPTTEMTLGASVYPVFKYHIHKTTFFSNDEAHIQLLQPATSYSPVFSELSIESLEEPLKCGADISITGNCYIVGETSEKFSIDLIYMVLSKGVIVYHQHEKVDVEASPDVRKENFTFKLSVVAELAPIMQVLVYSVLPSENVIAASKNFDVEKCFKNKVSLQFSPFKAVPGEKNTLELRAHPGSLCGLSVVDRSIFILEPDNRLNLKKIFNLLPVTYVSYYPYDVEDSQECLHVRPGRDMRIKHAYKTLKGVGLKMATNLAIRAPHCLVYKGEQYHRRYGEHGSIGHDYQPGAPSREIETARKFFPETWLWQLTKVGDSGSVQLPVTVPDTITTWETEAFCLSSKGLGLAPPVQLTVFQPFFLELSLPYSIIRGEVFELKATVFNYLSKCIMVKVTPDPSLDYKLEPSSDGEYSSCLCANGRKTFKWTLIPSVLGVLNVTVSAEAEQSQTVCDNEIVSVPERGRIDTVTQSLIVQGGVNDDVTITAYITASLLELGNNVQDTVVNKGLMCISSSVSNLANTYTTALLAYTFSLAGKNEARQQLLKELNNVAISGDGQLHWSQSASDDSGILSVEISSYVLLAVLTGQLTAADLDYANKIVSWLVKQQNPYGGFSSTQDTVIALQALALYSTKVFGSDGSSTVTVKSANGDSHTFDVNQNNKLLYQERSLQVIPEKYSIEVEGSSCVSVQTALFYNVPIHTETSTLSITAKTEGNCTKLLRQPLTLKFTVEYNGPQNTTNMIIVDIKLLSGFTADANELKNSIFVERVDSKDDHIIMYIKELSRNVPITYKLHIKQVLLVKNLNPALIKVYDYYQT